MAWTLYRYILRELLKIMLVTVAVLVALMSFAAAIRPISDGLLSPAALGKFVVYTAPTVLGFALPFAGAFASTLVFSRMAQDNEVLACCAGGISYRRLLAPVLLLGLALTLTLLLLSNTVVPGFYRAATGLAKADIISVLVSRLNQSKPFVGISGLDGSDDFVIVADGAEVFAPEEVPSLQALETDAVFEQVVRLRGVVVGELVDRQQRRAGGSPLPVRDVTAEEAVVLVYRWPGQRETNVWIDLKRTVSFDPASNDYARAESTDIGRLTLPPLLSDEIKFYSAAELEDLQQHPERYDRVRDAMDDLTRALATERLFQAITTQLDNVVFDGAIPGDRYVLRAPGEPRRGKALRFVGTAEQPVVVERYSQLSLQADRVYRAAAALVSVHESPFSQDLMIDVELREVDVLPGNTQQPTIRLGDLTWPAPIFEAETAAPGFDELSTLATSPDYAGSPQVETTRERLRHEFVRLHQRINSQRHERAASATSCTLLLLLGAILSVHLRHQLPLVVFFWAFVLAILTIILVSTGENLASDARFPSYFGLGVIWSGNVVLACVLGWVYCRVARH